MALSPSPRRGLLAAHQADTEASELTASEHWGKALDFIERERTASRSLPATASLEAVQAAARALLCRNSARQIMELEQRRGYPGGYAPLLNAAKRIAKGKGEGALRADAHCVLAILAAPDPGVAAVYMGSAITLRAAHFRQHLLRCGMLMHAGEADGGGAEAALADALAARDYASSELERWEATGMAASCLLQLDRCHAPHSTRIPLLSTRRVVL